MIKRMALGAAITVIAFQALAGVASAKACPPTSNGLGCDPQNPSSGGSVTCTLAAGVFVVDAGSGGSVTLSTDGVYLYCDGGSEQKLANIDRVLVTGDSVTFDLKEWNSSPEAIADFGDLAVTVDIEGALQFDASGLGAYYAGSITVSDTKFSGHGLVGTIYAGDSVSYNGSVSDYAGDMFDASKVTNASVHADGQNGPDTLKGGGKGDELIGGSGADKLYGNGGGDNLNCDDTGAGSGNDQCWGGAGNDPIFLGGVKGATGYDVAAPGDGFDVVQSSDPFAVTYVDSSVPVEFSGYDTDADAFITDNWTVETDVDFDTLQGADLLISVAGSNYADKLILFPTLDGGLGADTIVGTPEDDSMIGGGGNDKIRTGGGDDEVYGGGGNDIIYAGAGDDRVFGGGGDDVAYGSGGSDLLRGNKGSDQGWGGPGLDTCATEIRDNCEYRKG